MSPRQTATTPKARRKATPATAKPATTAIDRAITAPALADASATRDLPWLAGNTIPAATVHAAVLAGLGDRIAEIVEVATLEAMTVN